MTKKKVLAAVAVVAVLVLGTTSFNRCPWLQKQWSENVVPLLREAGPDVAPVTSD